MHVGPGSEQQAAPGTHEHSAGPEVVMCFHVSVDDSGAGAAGVDAQGALLCWCRFSAAAAVDRQRS